MSFVFPCCLYQDTSLVVESKRLTYHPVTVLATKSKSPEISRKCNDVLGSLALSPVREKHYIVLIYQISSKSANEAIKFIQNKISFKNLDDPTQTRGRSSSAPSLIKKIKSTDQLDWNRPVLFSEETITVENFETLYSITSFTGLGKVCISRIK